MPCCSPAASDPLGDLVALSAKKWFTGAEHTIDEAVIEAFDA